MSRHAYNRPSTNDLAHNVRRYLLAQSEMCCIEERLKENGVLKEERPPVT